MDIFAIQGSFNNARKDTRKFASDQHFPNISLGFVFGKFFITYNFEKMPSNASEIIDLSKKLKEKLLFLSEEEVLCSDCKTNSKIVYLKKQKVKICQTCLFEHINKIMI